MTHITFPDTAPDADYVAAAAQTIFDIDFPFFSGSTDIDVYRLPAGGTTWSLLTYNSQYSVTGTVGYESGYPGGYITLVTPSTADDRIAIRRSVGLQRLTDFPTSGPFQVRTLNTELDRLTAADQDLAALIDRTVHGPIFDSAPLGDLPDATARAGRTLVFDGDGAVSVGAIAEVSGTLMAMEQVGTGSQTVWTLPASVVGGSRSLIVAVDGVVQPVTSYTVSGFTLTFGQAPPLNAAVDVRIIGAPVVVSLADSTQVTATGSTTARTLAARFADTVNVKDNGAAGDGVTNDTAVIQAVIDAAAAGTVIYFPRGTYLVSGLLMSGTSANRTGLTYQGEGATLQLVSGLAVNVGEITSGTGYRVRGLTFRGNKGTVTTPGTDLSYRYYNGLYIGPDTGHTLSDVQVSGCTFCYCAYDGLMIGSGPVAALAIGPGVDHVTVTGCSIHHNEVGQSGGVQRHCTYSNNVYYNNDIYSILIDVSSSDVTVSGNTMQTDTAISAGGCGVFVYDATHVTISNNAMYQGKNGVIITTGASQITITGNTIHSPTAVGVYLSNCSMVTVTANTIKSTGQYGVSVSTAATQVSIIGNIIKSAAFDGIFASAASTLMISGNTVTGCNGSGIYLNGCAWSTISSNTCLNNNVNGGDAVSSGIRLLNTTTVQIIGNRCLDSQATKTQNYGCLAAGTSDSNVLVANDFSSNKLAEKSLTGSANMLVANAVGDPDVSLPGGLIKLASGSAAAPAYSYAAATDDGMYRSGAGNLGFALGGVLQFLVQKVASAVNYAVLRGSTTTTVTLFPDGTGTDLDMKVNAKGTGASWLQSRSLDVLEALGVASAVNRLRVTNAVTGSPPIISAEGTDTDIRLSLISKGGLPVQARRAADVNWLELYGSATANRVVLAAAGADTNIALTLQQKGTAVMSMTGQTTGTTVGAAGAASALPATPTGYLTVALNGTQVKFPYYTV